MISEGVIEMLISSLGQDYPQFFFQVKLKQRGVWALNAGARSVEVIGR